MTFNYSDFTIGELCEYDCYNFVCDGDSKIITSILKSDEELIADILEEVE